ncbi:glutathione synthase [Litoribrevibacter albus]|uniref:Glutathione synthetase n=1 Tax=Litoribrevibacter albus TaxID=1473156 RepID=A0AA37W6V7_9GAMM|nr:glutathione synthase [Litoribrevibacter albus]GLQ30568.1 glutathione synthetase [Litoribrevibacter albus]
MTIKLGIVMDPIQSIHYKKDTSLAMLWAAQDRNWELFYMEPQDLYLEDGHARATVKSLTVFRSDQKWFEFNSTQDIELSELDVILMRKDPPFDNEFIYATYLLERAEQQGTLIVNKPSSLRDCNEKMYATAFPQCTPPHLVSKDAQRLKAFHQKHQDTIYKPLDGMGGSSIFHVKEKDTNLSVIIETLTNHGQQQIMAQKYLPEIVQGDKRILMINGEPVPYCLARIPAAGESRGNLAAGGSGEVRPLSDRDRWICNQVSDELKRRKLYFVGLDVIGDYLTEINVTSPTCLREISNETGIDIAGQLMDVIEAELDSRK